MLKAAIKKCYGYEIKCSDIIIFQSSYCDPRLVDVVIEQRDGTELVFEAYDLDRHCFPYDHE